MRVSQYLTNEEYRMEIRNEILDERREEFPKMPSSKKYSANISLAILLLAGVVAGCYLANDAIKSALEYRDKIVEQKSIYLESLSHRQ